MKKAARIVASLILAGAMAAPAFAGFEFHGYGRAGVILNADGGKAKIAGQDSGVFNVKGPTSPFLYNPGRLGNETTNYFEAVLTNTFKAGTVNGATTIRLQAKDENYNAWGNAVNFRELYSELSNLPFSPKATVWAGKRFYGREDIHVNDWFYKILDGTGAGVMNIEAGPGVLDVAFIASGDAGNAADADVGVMVQKNLDFKYKGIKAVGGEFDVQATISSLPDQNSSGNDSGIALSAGYARKDFFGITPGFSKAVVQYGTGLGAGLQDASTWWYNKDASNLRVIGYGVSEIGDKLKMMSSLYFQTGTNMHDGTPNNLDKEGSSMGLTIRPEYHLTRNFALVAEYGMLNVLENDYNWQTGKEGMLHKLTIAPTLTLDDTSFWVRPQLRAFVTYGTWDEKLTGSIADGTYTDEESGIAYGVQMESWF